MNLVFDVEKQELKEVKQTEQEISQAEIDRLTAEEEAKKPVPPTLGEQLAEKEKQIQDIRTELKSTQDTLDFLLLG